MTRRIRNGWAPLVLGILAVTIVDGRPVLAADDAGKTLTGKDALGDWTTDAPGVRRKITLADLASPFDTPSVRNQPRVVKRPDGAWPKAPEGFAVTEFATGLNVPRVIVRAPNGDLFLAESRANRVRVFRDADGDGKPEVNEVFASWAAAAVRDRVLSAGPRTEISLRRQHRIGRPLPVPATAT